jgi:hypothetical protein
MAAQSVGRTRPRSSIRARLGITEEHLVYLDRLRDSGVTNMFGAAPYVAARFGVPDVQARIILGHWMRTFADRRLGVRG